MIIYWQCGLDIRILNSSRRILTAKLLCHRNFQRLEVVFVEVFPRQFSCTDAQ